MLDNLGQDFLGRIEFAESGSASSPNRTSMRADRVFPALSAGSASARSRNLRTAAGFPFSYAAVALAAVFSRLFDVVGAFVVLGDHLQILAAPIPTASLQPLRDLPDGVVPVSRNSTVS